MQYQLERLTKAGRLEQIGDWQSLRLFCVEWVNFEPKNPFAWLALGNSLRRLNEPEEAIAMYQTGLELVPPNPVEFMGFSLSPGPFWFGLGNAFFDVGQFQKAVDAFLKCIEIDPDVSAIWNDLGRAYMNRTPRDSQAAFKAFRRAMDLDPNDITSLKNLGLVYAMGSLKQGVDQVYQLLLNMDKSAAELFLKEARHILASR